MRRLLRVVGVGLAVLVAGAAAAAVLFALAYMMDDARVLPPGFGCTVRRDRVGADLGSAVRASWG